MIPDYLQAREEDQLLDGEEDGSQEDQLLDGEEDGSQEICKDEEDHLLSATAAGVDREVGCV